MEELKKCPFCGGEATVKMEKREVFGWIIFCECNKCNAVSNGYTPNMDYPGETLGNIEASKKLAISRWNKRVE